MFIANKLCLHISAWGAHPTDTLTTRSVRQPWPFCFNAQFCLLVRLHNLSNTGTEMHTLIPCLTLTTSLVVCFVLCSTCWDPILLLLKPAEFFCFCLQWEQDCVYSQVWWLEGEGEITTLVQCNIHLRRLYSAACILRVSFLGTKFFSFHLQITNTGVEWTIHYRRKFETKTDVRIHKGMDWNEHKTSRILAVSVLEMQASLDKILSKCIGVAPLTPAELRWFTPAKDMVLLIQN